MADWTKLVAVLRDEVERGRRAERALDLVQNTREGLKARIAEAEAAGRTQEAFALKVRLMGARPEADVAADLSHDDGRPA